VVVGGLLAGLALALVLEFGRVMLGRNEHAVLPGLAYRCAQLTGEQLEQAIRKHQIRTVVNLRGCNPQVPWYVEEARATCQTDAAQEDISFSAGRVPSIIEMRRLVEVLDRTEYPILLHCKRGADRTGLAAAVLVLLQADGTLAEARRQLGLRYGHVALRRPAFLDTFLDQYEAWLSQQAQDHSQTVFRQWLRREYIPAGYRGTIEALDLPAWVPVGKPVALRFRVQNTGTSSWPLRRAKTAGLHLAYVLEDAAGTPLTTDRTGLRDQVVLPGQSIELIVPLPRLKAAGRYRLLVDMVDEQHLWFFQTGSDLWEWEFEARDEVAASAG
jgi:protein tyrosine phosphatase (PTP) superfamily phosphohydrolase (DUF442 family)